MTLPKLRPDDVAVEVDEDIRKLIDRAQDAIKQWSAELEQLKNKLKDQMGDATVATVNGQLVATWRPKATWRTSDLRRDYPDLTDHYMVTDTVTKFDVERFAAVHPDVAEKYQTRALDLK
jgi:hypothetical protein